MKKSTIWGLAMTTLVVSGAVAASTMAPALTRAEGDETEVVYILDPESGALVNDLQTISISFPENKDIHVNNKMPLPFVLTNTETGKEYYCNYPDLNPRASQDGMVYTLNFLTPIVSGENEDYELLPITELGTYELSIKAGAFICADEVEGEEGTSLENIVPVQEINATYKIVEPVLPVAYILNPEDGAYVNDIQSITISFEDIKVQPNDRSEGSMIVLTAENGEEYYCDAPVRDTRVAQGVAYTLNFLTPGAEEGDEAELKPITEPGKYALSIMKGAFIRADEVEGEEGVTLENIVPIEAINATYTVVEAAPEVAYTLEPEDGAIVNDLQTITISFENMTVQPNERMEFNAIVLTAENGEEYYCDAPVRDSRAAQGVAYKLNFLTSTETEEGIESELLPITEPGKYTLSIMKGAFIYGDEVEGEESVTLENTVAVQAINATYTVVEAAPAVAYTLEPEDGAIVNDLQTITISFENKTVQPNERMLLNSFVLTNTETGEEYLCEAPVRDTRVAQGVAYKLNFLTPGAEEGDEAELKPITKPGKYSLSIMKGAFVYGDEVEGEESVSLENLEYVEAINATYTVAEAVPAVAYTLEPENGAIVNDLQTITISFENKNVQLNDKMEFNAIVLTAENGEEYYCDAPLRDTRVAQGVAYTLNFLTAVETEEGVENVLNPITEPGTYKLSILKGTFMLADEVEGEEGVGIENVVPVEAINATYTVAEAAPAVAYTLEPEDGAIVNDLQTITISFENKNVQLNERMEFNAIVLTAENGEEYYCDAPVRDTRVAQGVAYKLNFLTSTETEEGMESELLPITEPGKYTLSILKGTFMIADEVEGEEGVSIENPVPVEAINATYTVAEAAPAVAYTLEPEDGAIVNDLQTITISFENKNVQLNDRMELNAIVLTAENGEEYYCDAPVRDTRVAQGVAYKLNFLTSTETEEGMESELLPITEPGTYKLSIMKGTFILADEVEGEEGVGIENIVPVEAINATYTVAEAAPEVTYTLEPEDGAIVNDLQTITISFEDVNVRPNERMELNAIVLTNTETGEEYYCDAPVRDSRAALGVAYTLNFLTTVENENGFESELLPITDPGQYTLSIMKGAFIRADEVEGEEGVTLENIVPVQAINATYTVVGAVAQVVYELNPEDGAYVNDLQTITITFPYNSTVQPNERMLLNAFVLTNTDTGEEYICDAPVRNTRVAHGVAYTLNFLTSVENGEEVETVLEPITESGTYQLSIMQGAFVYGEEVEDEEGNVSLASVTPIQAINATYIILTTGVNSIFGEDANEFDVYGVNGLQILKSADSDAVNALPAGLYIINGKKVIKR